MGHLVSAEGVKVAVDNIDAASSWSMPTCVREVQGFLGLGKLLQEIGEGLCGNCLAD